MPFLKLQFRPGIVRDTTNYANEGGWYECDKVRFFSGYPQKIGGWIEATSQRISGTCRQMLNWVTSYQDNLLAVGTNTKVYIEVGGYFYDITPTRATFSSPDTDDCIETVGGSNIVIVNIVGHGAFPGNFVRISGVTGDVGGIPNAEINTIHEVLTVLDADSFTIQVTTPADIVFGFGTGDWNGSYGWGDPSQTPAIVTGGGNSIVVEFEIYPGLPATVAGYGWGTGAWNGDYAWGLASPTPIYQPQRDWWFDNFDNDLVMNIRAEVTNTGIAIGGPIYYWERGFTVNPTSALSSPAVLLSSMPGANEVPETANQILVSQNDKHLLALGCQPFGGGSDDFDPLLIRWADQDNPFEWEPLPTNSAGFIKISRGSSIVRGLPTRQEIVVFTETHLYSLQFLGTTDVFGLQELADNISIMSPRSCIAVNNVVYWMGLDKFYMYDGRVQTLPCSVREYVFKDINYAQADQVICGTNEGFNEVWWFYCSQDSGWVDRYVIYNHLDQIWYYGQLGRTAWLDVSSRDFPTAIYTDEDQNPGILYTHEVGIDAAGEPLPGFIQSSDFDIKDGDQFMLTKRIVPDINFNTSTAPNPEVTFQVKTRNFPGSSFSSEFKPVIETNVDQYTDQIFIRLRGRQMALKVSSEGLGVQWQLGNPRLDAREDGKR
jgi:hypothetical protein